MKPTDMDSRLIDSYMDLLKNLNDNSKRTLISRLNASVETKKQTNDLSFKNAFGAWDDNDAAEKLVEFIRTSRQQSRTIEGL